jgi:hypothetical protein
MNADGPHADRRAWGEAYRERSRWDPIAYTAGGAGLLLLVLLNDESMARNLVGSAIWTGAALLSARVAAAGPAKREK